MVSIRVGGDTIEARLTALDTAVDGLLGDLSGLSRDDIVAVLQRLETSLGKASAVGHRLIVEAVERRVSEDLGCRSVGDFLIGTLRISGADATRRVKGAKKAGTRHSLVALRQLLSSGVLGSHRGLPVATILTMTVTHLEDETGIVTTAPATLTAVHHITEWKDGGPPDIGNEDLACDLPRLGARRARRLGHPRRPSGCGVSGPHRMGPAPAHRPRTDTAGQPPPPSRGSAVRGAGALPRPPRHRTARTPAVAAGTNRRCERR